MRGAKNRGILADKTLQFDFAVLVFALVFF